MRNRLLFVVLGAVLLCASLEARAQAQFYFHLGTSRFLEAEKAGEERIRSDAARTSRNLAPLCYVYYKLNVSITT